MFGNPASPLTGSGWNILQSAVSVDSLEVLATRIFKHLEIQIVVVQDFLDDVTADIPEER